MSGTKSVMVINLLNRPCHCSSQCATREKLWGGVQTGLSGNKIEKCKLKSTNEKVTLHPLIHTLLEFTLAQDIESINKRSRSSARSLNDAL